MEMPIENYFVIISKIFLLFYRAIYYTRSRVQSSGSYFKVRAIDNDREKLRKLPLLIILSIPLQSLYRPCSSTHGPSIVSSTELYPLRTRPQRFPSFGLWVIPLGTEVV